MQTINVAIVGFGLSGATFHTPEIQAVAGFRIVAVVSSNADKVAKQLPEVSVFSTLDALLAEVDVDLVVISTPNVTHYELAKTALTHAKHVVIDKPWVLTSNDANRLIQLATQKQCLLCSYQNRRWDRAIQMAKKLLQEGTLGEIYQCDIHFDRYRPQATKNKWKEKNVIGGGSFYDLAPHLIDHALYLFGEPLSLYADIAKQRSQAETADYFHLLLNYERIKVILHSSSVIIADTPYIQLHGEKGSYISYQLTGHGKPENPKTKLVLINGDETVDLSLTGEMTYYQQLYAAMTSDAEPPVSFADMLANCQLIEFALASRSD